MAKIICGVDVSKARLDVFVAGPNVAAAFDNTAEGVDALAGFCREHGVALVAMEATGGLEKLAFLLLWKSGLPCARVNPRQVRDFAKAAGALEKTDAIDARLIAGAARALNIVETKPPSDAQQRLEALTTRLSQIVADLVTQKQRRHTTSDALARGSIEAVIAFLDAEARRFEKEIAAEIEKDPLWARLDAALRSVKGVADRTVARLLAELPEIGVYSNKAIVKLAGLAPIANDSGARRGNRHIRGGRARVRSILFLVAGIAMRFDKKLKAFHNALIQKGKPKMVARIALARKLLVILNARAREARDAFPPVHP
ncbi:IS110 family transposase [Methylocystis sp. JAN1]|uniref:IS110 family transposase n=1 Tax=Methylocystis sp. JAN1 TaxID=3397211 RepID=UPI003FA246B0